MNTHQTPNIAELPSSQQLRKSTLTGIGIAAVLLVTVVLPSEYNIDPTGMGRVLGLIQAAAGTGPSPRCTVPASRSTSMLATMAGNRVCGSASVLRTTTAASTHGIKSGGGGRCWNMRSMVSSPAVAASATRATWRAARCP